MDATAISLCMDNSLPIVVFNLRTPGNIRRGDRRRGVGTGRSRCGHRLRVEQAVMDVNDLKGLFAEVNKRMDAAIEHVRKELAACAPGAPR